MINVRDIDIRTLLPQQDPVVMVDGLLDANIKSVTTHYLVRPDNIFVADGRLNPCAYVEIIAQTCAAQLGYVDKYLLGHDFVRIGYIGGVKDLQVEHVAEVGETLTTRIEILEDVMDMRLASAEIFVGEQRMAVAEIKIAVSQESI